MKHLISLWLKWCLIVAQIHMFVSFHGPVLQTIIQKESQGAISIRKMVLPGMAILMLKIRRPNGRLIFNMEIAICR